MTAWRALPTSGPALLVEDSPWAYLTRMAALIPPDERTALRGSLAPPAASHTNLHAANIGPAGELAAPPLPYEP